MDIQENGRMVVSKPIASRPTSSFESFSDLLEGAFDASSHTKSSEAAVSAIRPKTVKLSSMTNRTSPKFSSSQAGISETAPSNMCNQIPHSRNQEFVIHKPLAKLVSRTTISLLETMKDNLSISQQQPQRPTKACYQYFNQDKCILRNQPSSCLQQRIASEKKSNQAVTPSDGATQSLMENVKLPPSNNFDLPSYNGYNWRKYGQKQVKGSEYPRSYYRCTHPSCPVKKKVERSFGGTIAEIYKGEHNHSKPQPPTRTASVTDGAGPVAGGVDQDTNQLLLSNHLCQKNDSSEVSEKNRNENAPIFRCSYQYKDPRQYDCLPTLSSIAGAETSEHTCGLSGEYEEGSKKFDALEDEPESKRRKSRNQLFEVRSSSDVLLEASTVVQNSADSELLEDGFRWRKYGQKLVKGNPYPRSYYRCTNVKCSVRKHVERSADDPQAFLTTYEGKHNHEMPLRSHHPVASG